MKKLFVCLSLLPSLLWGAIFESGRMEDVIPHVTKETWVFFDVDNTLIESSQQLGSPQWRKHILKKAHDAGYRNEEQELVLDKFWFFVQHFVPVRLVDPYTVGVIQQLAESNAYIFGLTAREPIESGYTQRQLDSVGISLPSGSSSAILLANEPAVLEQGVIYCGENTKSEGVIAFFEEMGRIPKKMVIVDDRLDQLKALEETAQSLGIEYIGIRFSAADQRVQAFDGDIADVQFSYLPKVVSDEDANEMLHGFIDLYEPEE